MPDVYSIRDWNTTFERAHSRKVSGPLTWVSMPTKHDGKVYRKIMARKDGLMIFAAWVLLIEVAAKCACRGVLADADGPLTAADLEFKTGCPATAFETALKVLSSKDFGWIDKARWEDAASVLPLQDRTGQDKAKSASADLASAELRNGEATAADATEFVFPTTGRGPKEWILTKPKLAEYVAAYPGLDVTSEFRKARQWCIDNVRKRKTSGGMPAFLTNWLNRAQNRGGGKGSGDELRPQYREVTPEIFKKHIDAKEFLTRPLADPPDANGTRRWFGQLRNGRKIECRK